MNSDLYALYPKLPYAGMLTSVTLITLESRTRSTVAPPSVALKRNFMSFNASNTKYHLNVVNPEMTYFVVE